MVDSFNLTNFMLIPFNDRQESIKRKQMQNQTADSIVGNKFGRFASE